MITPEQRERAVTLVQVNLALQLGMIVMHLAGLGSLAMNLFREMSTPHHGGSPFQNGEFVGRMIAFGITAIWVLAGFVWLPINAWGLSQRKRWALQSTRAYWAASLVTCCCTPIGAIGLFTLFRPGVAEELDK